MYKLVASLCTAVLALPMTAAAQGIAQSSDAGPLQDLLINILDFSNDVLIPFILGLGFLFFVWGMFKYFIWGGANEEKKEQGKSLIIWATVGFVAVIIFWGVVNVLTESTGLADAELENIPRIQVDN